MLALHLSDLHLSRYGESGMWSKRDDDDDRWTPVQTWQGWQVEGLRDKRNRPDKLRLVDPSGVVHKESGWPRKDDKAITALLALAMERHLTSAKNLIMNPPTREDLTPLLRVDPQNTNLLFLRLIYDVLPLEPELILISGDVTDNGFGYSLVEHHLASYIEQGRLFVVPGNHDTYDMIPRKGRRDRIQAKAERFRAFASKTGMVANECGAWFHIDRDVALVGLNSCKAPLTPLSASGEVSEEQLAWVASLGDDRDFAGARLRIGMVHHHLLRMPFELGKRSPIEMGLRLRNAREVMRTCQEAGFDLLLNGHRHHGYAVQLPGHPLVVSSPSSTLGCKSTDMEYVWTLDLADERPFPQVHELSDTTGGRPYFKRRRGRGRARGPA